MQRWTINQQLGTAFGALLLLFLVFGVSTFQTIDRLNSRAASDAEALAATARVGLLTMRLSAAADMVVVAGYRRDAAAVDAEWADAAKGLADLRLAANQLAASTSVEANRDRARRVAEAMGQWHATAAKAADLARTLRADEASAMMENSEQYSDDIAATLVDEILRDETQHAAESRAAATAAKRLTATVLAAAVLLLAGFVGFVVLGVDRALSSVSATLGAGASAVASAAGQVASASTALSDGANAQAASLEETSAAMQEIAAMVDRTTAGTSEVATLMAHSSSLVSEANAALDQMTTSMSSISDSSSQIGRILRTIDEIAFQTNILALNAAVEAARAGEAGMGFAVVANEVRTLAMRSADAARDTGQIIDASIVSAQQGATSLAAVAHAVRALTENAERVTAIATDVQRAADQQSTGIAQVKQAIGQLEQITLTTAASAQESAAAGDELNAQATSTLHSAEQLQALVSRSPAPGGAGSGAPHSRRPHPVSLGEQEAA